MRHRCDAIHQGSRQEALDWKHPRGGQVEGFASAGGQGLHFFLALKSSIFQPLDELWEHGSLTNWP